MNGPTSPPRFGAVRSTLRRPAAAASPLQSKRGRTDRPEARCDHPAQLPAPARCGSQRAQHPRPLPRPKRCRADQERRQLFIDEAGSESIGDEQLRDSLDGRRLGGDVELVAGDICATAAEYVAAHPALRISLLHIDVDVYEPTKAILEHLAPCVPRGGVILFDDYGTFTGETSAVDEYLSERPGWRLRVLPGIPAPSYVIVP